MSQPNALQTRWKALAPRERLIVAVAIVLIVVAVLWWVALAPALRTLSMARSEHARLDAQLLQMTTLQAQAKALQTQPRAGREDALRTLQESVHQAMEGKAQLQGIGENANMALRGVSAEVLAQWLAQARVNAQTVPREVHLTRAQATASPAAETKADPKGKPLAKADSASASAQWDGTLVMGLPLSR